MKEIRTKTTKNITWSGRNKPLVRGDFNVNNFDPDQVWFTRKLSTQEDHQSVTHEGKIMRRNFLVEWSRHEDQRDQMAQIDWKSQPFHRNHKLLDIKDRFKEWKDWPSTDDPKAVLGIFHNWIGLCYIFIVCRLFAEAIMAIDVHVRDKEVGIGLRSRRMVNTHKDHPSNTHRSHNKLPWVVWP